MEAPARARRSRCGAATRWPTSPDEPFAAAEIRRLEELRLRATELAIDGDLAAGRHARGARRSSRRWSRRIRCSERLHAQRMLALYRCRPPGRGAGGLPAPRAKCSSSRSASSPVPSCAASTKRCSSRTRRSTCPPSRRTPHRAFRLARRVGACSRSSRRRLVLVGGLAVFAVSRLTESDRLARIDENAVGVIDPDSGRITAQVTVGRGPSAHRRRRRLGMGRERGCDGTVSRLGRGRDADRSIPVGDRPTALAFAAGSLWVVDAEGRMCRASRPGDQPGRGQDRGRQRAEWHRRRVRSAVGHLRGRPDGGPDRPADRGADRDRSRREPDGGRHRRGRGVGDERGGARRVPDRASLAGGERNDRCRQRPGRRRRRRGRPSGSSNRQDANVVPHRPGDERRSRTS